MDQKANADHKKEEREQVIELGSDVTKSSKGNIYTLTIIGQVEGHQVLPETVKTTKYEHVLPLLAGIEENDEIVLIDYKTDHVKTEEELVKRYKKQLEIYAESLEQMTGKRVKERILYSFCLGKEIFV